MMKTTKDTTTARTVRKKPNDKKKKKDIQQEKHTRLQAYLDAKRLQEELDAIEGWVEA